MDLKTRELIALAAACSTNRLSCVEHYKQSAVEAGATEEEVRIAIEVAGNVSKEDFKSSDGIIQCSKKTDKSMNVLSQRELEVLNWLKFGKTSWDISKILNITERTVNFHCSSITKKMDAVSRAHALAIAIDIGLIAMD